MAPARLAAALLTALAVTACTGGVDGTPGASGTRDPLFPRLGNDGYDVQHYSLDLDYDPASGHLKGGATIVARAAKDLSAFDLDFAGHGRARRPPSTPSPPPSTGPETNSPCARTTS